MNLVNQKKSQTILRALEALEKELEKPTGAVTSKKKDLRDSLSDALLGTKSEQWWKMVRDRYACWVPATLDADGVRSFADKILNHPSTDLKHIFPEDDFAQDLGL